MEDFENFTQLAIPGVQELKPYQPGKPISELEREYGVSNILKLASNENPLGPSTLAVAAARQALTEVSLYPDGNGFELKQALAKLHSVPQNSITLGNGSNDVLELLARTFLTPADNAIFSKHAFAVYPIVTQAVGAQALVSTPNSADHDQPYGYNLDEIQRLIDENTKLIFIANPNNPTGTWIKATELEQFIQAVPENVIVVVDEAYFEYVQVTDYPDTSQWLGRYPNLVVTRTFSKAYGLAGLRIGYALSNPEIADLLNRVRQPFNVNAIAQAAALAALQDRSHIEKSVTLNQQGLRQLANGFTDQGLSYIPSVANFICVQVGEPAQVYETLLRAGIIVRPVENYLLPGFIRITVGSSEDNRRVLAALQQAVKKRL